MHFLQRYTCYAALIGFAATNGLYGQVSSINSAVVQPRVFNDVPGATITVVTNYPSGISFNEQGVSTATFIVNTDGHEVVQFGGIGFYSFNVSDGILYNSGDTIRLGMTYFLDGNGKNALVFSANGVSSPVEEFTTPGDGIGNNSTLGGYFQIVNDSANAANAGSALFQNISISGVVPEPSTFALFSLGIVPLGLLLRRRCRG